jgi:hypothetical protein
MSKRTELRREDVGDKVCPFLVAACVASGKPTPGNAECWMAQCQLWIPTELSCGLETLRMKK